MTETEGRKASPRFVEQLRAWREREELLLSGAAIPGVLDRARGHSPFKNSALLDLRQCVALEIERDRQPHDLLDRLQGCSDVPTGARCWAAYLEFRGHDSDVASTLLWHAAIRSQPDAVRQLTIDAMGDHRPFDQVGWLMGAAFAVGLMANAHDGDGLDAEDIERCREKGFTRLRALGSLEADYDAAVDAIDDAGDLQLETGMDAALAAMKAAQAEPVQDEIIDDPDLGEPVGPTLLIIDADPEQKQPSARADVWKAYKPVIGTALPLVSTAAVPAARTALHARYPHMHAEVDAILSTQAALQSVRLAVLLVGEPGSGKTTFARDLAELLGVPSMTYSCAGASDGAFGGTSAQWNSARPATPLQLVGRSRTANPLVVLDEVDKIGLSKHNGSLSDTLLTFLEPTSSKVFYDLALEQPADLSAVSYIATANNLDDVPAALRDRFKIVRIPDAGFEHLGTLTERIIDDLARDRGLDRRWLEPLAPDEIELVRQAWLGGSLRRLTRIVTIIIDGRDAYLGRA